MSSLRRDPVDKYLERYAEPEAMLGARLNRLTRHIVVIPAHDESATFLDGILPSVSGAAADGERVLCIVVVNATDGHDSKLYARNQVLVDALKSCTAADAIWDGVDDTPCWYGNGVGFDLVIIDRNSSGHRLPRHEGVGLARKIGGDFALAAIHAGASQAQLIHMTDCDVCLPADYFKVSGRPSTSALIYRFLHEPSGEPIIDEAHARYEAYLRYYILGLRHAGSPYAFHAIGSCIATGVTAYAGVRGVPKRQAGEDFYLLNKLAKVGQIETAAGSPIRIRARHSLRVPFGTGRSTHDIAKDVDAYCIYDPAIFDLLMAWIGALPSIEGVDPHRAYDCVRSQAEVGLDASEQTCLKRALAAIGAPKALHEAAAQSTSFAVRRKWLNDWFDAFRTLKFVHALRDTGYVDVGWHQALTGASFCDGLVRDGTDETIMNAGSFELCRRLETLETGT